jgi:beta-phosphoglucomutase-like phosphatase (HAD superfamily)
MTNIQAIIYDVDGTLINSESVHVNAWDLSLQQFGHTLDDLTLTMRQTMAGMKPVVIAQLMIDELKLPTITADFLATKTSIFLQSLDMIEPMPGAIDSINRFKNDFRLAIGTSLDRTILTRILENLGLKNAFEVIVTGDQIKNGKPDPETYLRVAEALRIAPEQCVVLEDAATGIASAKAAFMYCIAINNPQAITQDLAQADHTVSSLYEVTLELLEK